MKCPNCNAENAEGMKFCGECGTKLPEPMNHCPTCNKDWPINMKFCGECGFKFGGGSTAGTGIGSGAIALGDKNVISGDLVSNVSTVNNVSNVDNSSTINNTTNNTTNTTVINSDETAKLAKCHICGSLQKITTGYECPVCHEYTCNSCFVVAQNCCKACAEASQKQAAEAKIAGAMEFIDRLRNDFDSVSSDEVFEYLKNHNNPTTELFIETQKKLAKRYYENENWERVISVYKLAPDNIKLHDGDSLFMYGYALYEANNERLNNYDAKKIFDIAASKGNKDATVMKEIVSCNPVYVGSDATIKYGLMKYSDNMYAQYIIGYIYEEIRHEPALAKEWYEKAANQGHKSAIRRLEPFLKEEKRKAEEKAAAELQAKAEAEAQKEAQLKAQAETEAKAATIQEIDNVLADRKVKISDFVNSHGGYKNIWKVICEEHFTKEELEQYFPEAEEVLACCSGKIEKDQIKPTFGAAKPISTENYSCIFAELGTKVKEGDVIGYQNLLPEISPKEGGFLVSKDDGPYNFIIPNEAVFVGERYLGREYILYAEKGDVVTIDIEKNLSLKAPEDCFILMYTKSNSKPFIADVIGGTIVAVTHNYRNIR